MNLRILHYNIAHGRGNDQSPDVIKWLGPLGLIAGTLKKNYQLKKKGKKELISRLDSIAELTREQEVDIACFNEIDFDCNWSFNIDMLQYFSEQLCLRHTAYGYKTDLRLPWFKVQNGLGVVSRFPLSGDYHMCSTNKFPRTLVGGVGYQDLVVDVNGNNIRLVYCHLSPGTEGEIQTDEIYQNVIATSTEPVILAGDLNARLTEHQAEKGKVRYRNLDNLLIGGRLKVPLQLLEEGAEERYATFFSRYLGYGEVIDHVLVDREFEINSFEVLDVDYSDHKPVVVEIAMS